MNKLEEYRDNLLEQDVPVFDHEGHYGNNMIKKGFDAAIALDLPVKFAEWFETKEPSWKDWRREHYLLSDSELRQRAYQYWIENIYKPE